MKNTEFSKFTHSDNNAMDDHFHKILFLQFFNAHYQAKNIIYVYMVYS